MHVRAVPLRDEAGCPFSGPGVDLRGEAARAILDDAALIRPIRDWLEAREPGVVLRSVSVDLAARRVLVTLEPMTTEQRPRVVRIDPPNAEELLGAASALESAIAALSALQLRRRHTGP